MVATTGREHFFARQLSLVHPGLGLGDLSCYCQKICLQLTDNQLGSLHAFVFDCMMFCGGQHIL